MDKDIKQLIIYSIKGLATLGLLALMLHWGVFGFAVLFFPICAIWGLI